MSVMVLYLYQRQIQSRRKLAAELAGEIFRVSIDCNKLGAMAENLVIKIEASAELLVSFGIFQISQMLRQDRLALLQQANGIFQFSAQRQYVSRAGKPWWQCQSRRRVTSCSSQ